MVANIEFSRLRRFIESQGISIREPLFSRPREQQVPVSTVLALYQRLSPEGNKKFTELFGEITVWYDTVLTDPLARHAQIFYSPEIPPDHPDHLLTSYGKNLNLMAAAKVYLALQETEELPHHPYIENIQHFMDQLKSGAPLPHVIGVLGRIRHKLYIIDGNTRSIAAAIVGMENDGHFPPLKAYIGRPGLFSPLSRSSI